MKRRVLTIIVVLLSASNVLSQETKGNQDEDGNQINPNPDYDQAIRFQPPMSIRLGLEVEF